MKSLISLTENYFSIAIVGMCKNAGKTTVLNALIGAYPHKTLALTSIGRDGEDCDIVTQTAKPKIFTPKNSIVFTAASLLDFCSLYKEILYTTGIPSPLGEIVAFKAKSDGYAQLAGCSIVSQLTIVTELSKRYGAEKLLIDGALSRKSLSCANTADCSILCTGASYNKDISVTVSDTAFAVGLLATRQIDKETAALIKPFERGVVTQNGFKKITDLSQLDGCSFDALYLPNAITDSVIGNLLQTKSMQGKTLVCADSAKLMYGQKAARLLKNCNVTVKSLTPSTIVALCANAYSVYGSSYDPSRFLDMLRQSVPLPVFDVKNINL